MTIELLSKKKNKSKKIKKNDSHAQKKKSANSCIFKQVPGDLPVALSRIRTPPPTQNRSELCSIYAVSASARAQFTTYSMFILFILYFAGWFFLGATRQKKTQADKYLIERASPKKWRGLPGR